MNIRRIGWLRKAVYLWRNRQNKHSFKHGKNNTIINRGGIRVNSRIQVTGSRNIIIIERGALLLNSLVRIRGNENVVTLKSNTYVSGAELWVENNGCELTIGERTFVGHHSHLACTEDGCKLLVGSDGMISSNVQIRTGDSHSIVDMDGKRINPARSVCIGDHCWIGEGAKVLKGVELAGNDIISAGAIVTKSFGKNLLIGGIPGSVLKENVNWEQDRI